MYRWVELVPKLVGTNQITLTNLVFYFLRRMINKKQKQLITNWGIIGEVF